MARCNVCGKNVHSGLVIDKECLEKLKSWNGRCDELFNEIKARDKIIAEYDDKIERGGLVEVVRCKDCKYWQDNNAGYPHEYCKWNTNETPDADDFCSCGERSGKNEG